MELFIAFWIFVSGACVLGVGYTCLVCFLPKKAKDVDTQISMEALKASFWLVIFGLIIIILGFLYSMNLLPPPGW